MKNQEVILNKKRLQKDNFLQKSNLAVNLYNRSDIYLYQFDQRAYTILSSSEKMDIFPEGGGTNSLFPKITLPMNRYKSDRPKKKMTWPFPQPSKELHKLAANFFHILYKELPWTPEPHEKRNIKYPSGHEDGYVSFRQMFLKEKKKKRKEKERSQMGVLKAGTKLSPRLPRKIKRWLGE